MCLIAARQSHLARLQALIVGRALEKNNPNLKVNYHFRESLGDKNLIDPLWKMPEKGVFTEDFVDGLRSGEFDLVVHSWKDLPMDDRPGLEIVATMPRVDARDLLLVKKSFFEKNNRAQLRIFSSSPRRILNIADFLKGVWPFPLDSIEFESVRGNIPTRIRKMHQDQNIDGLIVAKAALDRLISAEANLGDSIEPDSEWAELKKEIQTLIQDCQWMVLPLSANPTAAAQGALAIEVASHREDIKKLVSKIHCEATFQNVIWEREILKFFGGGCHQAIGISVVNKGADSFAFVRGKTPAGERLLEIRRRNKSTKKLTDDLKICVPQSDSFFSRENHACDLNQLIAADALFFARSNCLPAEYKVPAKQILWTAGVKSWQKLAKDGFWINGCADSFGFEEPDLTFLAKPNLAWIRLTHEGALRSQGQELGSYKLVVKDSHPEIPATADLYYWKSGSLFERALELYPFLREKFHACGLGETSKVLKKYFEVGKNLFLFFDETDFLNQFSKSVVIPVNDSKKGKANP